MDEDDCRDGQNQFRGLTRVTAEVIFAALAYNLRRMANLGVTMTGGRVPVASDEARGTDPNDRRQHPRRP